MAPSFKSDLLFLLCLLLPPSFAIASSSNSSETLCPHLSLSNWKSTLALHDGPSSSFYAEWWILAVEGNDTAEETAFTNLLTTHPAGDVNPFLLNCTIHPILCHSWLLYPPALMYIQQSHLPPFLHPTTEWRRIQLETKTEAGTEPATKKVDPGTETETENLMTVEALLSSTSWKHDNRYLWDGFLHPYTGALGQWGGGYAWGAVATAFEMVPSWMLVIVAGVLMRNLVSKIQPTQPMRTAADQVVPPGSLD